MFVKLGIQGSEKTVGELKAVDKGLGDIQGTSLEAKAAILALFYETGKYVVQAGEAGEALQNFTARTGIQAKVVQELEWATMKATGKNVDLKSSLEQVQGALANIAKTGNIGALKDLGAIISTINSGIKNGIIKDKMVDLKEMQTWMYDMPLMVKRMQQFSDLTKSNPAMRYQYMKDLPFGNDMMTGFEKGAYEPSKMSSAAGHGMTDSEIANTSKEAVAWATMMKSFEEMVDKIVGNKDALKSIENLTSDIVKLMDAFNRADKKLHLIHAITGFVDQTLGGDITSGAYSNETLSQGPAGKALSFIKNGFSDPSGDSYAWHPPEMTSTAPHNTVNITMPVTITDGKDAYKTGQDLGRGVTNILEPMGHVK
jgi:hypothetical protein